MKVILIEDIVVLEFSGETDGIDSTKSMEQLLEEKAEKEAEYEALLKEPNPSKVL